MTHDPYGPPPGDDLPRDNSNQPDWGQQPPPNWQQPGYGQQYPYQPDWGQQPPPYWQQYPYPQPKQDDKALTALILAILGLFVCPIILNVIALVLANQSLRAIRASNGWLTGEGMANAARIISIIILVLWAIGLLFFVLFVSLAGFQTT